MLQHYSPRRRIAAGHSKAGIARDLKVSRMTVYRALKGLVAPTTEPPAKPPSVTIALHLLIEPFSKSGRGRKPARERIEAMLERDYAMMKKSDCEYRLSVAYDTEPGGVSLDDEIDHLHSAMNNIAESHRCSIEADIREIGGKERSW
ncbi:helix-turn-helix domain-containing protein [Rhizobium mongolense]|uniref:helix-turn-helix domain-containing protein n=1 Tax=Rhizobium mongolense TaxID=57676 RepID=UPI0034A24B71